MAKDKHGPQSQGAQQNTGHDKGQDRPQQRPGQPDHDQERGQVPDQHVLEHVDRQPLLGHRADRRHVREDPDGDAGRDQHEPVRRDGPPLARQGARADGDERHQQVERRGLDQAGEEVPGVHLPCTLPAFCVRPANVNGSGWGGRSRRQRHLAAPMRRRK